MRLLLSICTFLALAISGYSQVLVNPLGSFTEQGSYSLSSSVGEIVISTQSNSTWYLTQGFHQTDAKIVSISEQDVFADLVAYPNPFNNRVSLSGSGINQVTAVKLFDSRGQLVFHQPDLKGQQYFYLDKLSKGVYFLTAYEKGAQVKVFQLIKQ